MTVRIYGGHIFAVNGNINFYNCLIFDLTILYPLTNFVIIGGDGGQREGQGAGAGGGIGGGRGAGGGAAQQLPAHVPPGVPARVGSRGQRVPELQGAHPGKGLGLGRG